MRGVVKQTKHLPPQFWNDSMEDESENEESLGYNQQSWDNVPGENELIGNDNDEVCLPGERVK